MLTVADKSAAVHPPSIQRHDRLSGRASVDAVLAEAHAAVAAMTPAQLAEVVLAETADTNQADPGAVRLRLAAIALARHATPPPPPRRRVSAAELGRQLIAAVDRHNPYGRAADARITCLMLEWLDGADRITPAGRRALARLEGQ